MLRHLFYVVLVVPVMAALNTTWGPSSFIGAPLDFRRGPPNNTEPTTLLTSVLQQPNVTRSVLFQPFKNFTEIGTNNEAWSLRINISSFLVPYALSTNPASRITGSPDSHIVAVSYDLSWPSGGNMSAAMGARAPESLCITIPTVDNWPVNITNAYSESVSSSTSCEPILGKACVDRIVAGQMGGLASKMNSHMCASALPVGTFWNDFPECAGSFKYGKRTRPASGSLAAYGAVKPDGFRSNNSTVQSDGSWNDPWRSGKGLYTEVSEPVPGDRSTTYLEYSNRVHIVVLSAALPGKFGSTGHQAVVELMCMRVNYTRLADNVRTDGNVTAVKDAVLLPSWAGKVDLRMMVWLGVGTSISVALLTVG